MTSIMKQLQAPFPIEEIEFRVQSCGITNDKPWARVLAYVQARAIQRRLDEVFGWDGWTEEYRSINNNMICRLGVRTSKEREGWIYKENGASETDIEGFKGGISGALKRVAASGFGIGRYLYDLTESFAECTLEKPKNMNGWNKARAKVKKNGKDEYETIYWRTPGLPSWALPQITVEEVLTEWMELGGTEEQFDKKLKEWKVTKETLQMKHLLAIQSMLKLKRTGS